MKSYFCHTVFCVFNFRDFSVLTFFYGNLRPLIPNMALVLLHLMWFQSYGGKKTSQVNFKLTTNIKKDCFLHLIFKMALLGNILKTVQKAKKSYLYFC